MKILQLCNKSPYPPKEGGSMAMYAMTSLLQQQGHEVKIVAVNSPKYFVREEDVPENYRKQTRIEWVYIDTTVRPLSALHALVHNRSYHAIRFFDPKMEKRLEELLKEEVFDCILLETIYPAVYLPLLRKHSQARILIRSHNVEHRIWERMAAHGCGMLKKCYLRILSKQLKTFEINALKQADGIISISGIDMNLFRGMGISTDGITIPYSLEKIPERSACQTAAASTLFSLGSMDWGPNIEGVRWFVKECWPLIRRSHPHLVFRIAGRNLPENLLETASEGVEMVGEVPDAGDFMLANGLMIVPLLSGSGIRIKIIEGMSLGKCIITTHIGAEGIDVKDREQLMMADSPQDFLEAVTYCLSHPEESQRMGENAAAFTASHFDARILGERLQHFLQKIV